MSTPYVILLSSDVEWQFWVELNQNHPVIDTPFGGCIEHTVSKFQVISMRSGWGKISAAASTQWAIDHYHPKLILNLGTCGGLEGRTYRETIILVEKTRVYDIHEQMTDPQEASNYYSSELDLSWLGDRKLPEGVIRSTMFSADRDIFPEDVSHMIDHYDARVADWESGAIAWVAALNKTPLLILRGVSDLVNPVGGESYTNIEIYRKNTRNIMQTLAGQLSWWLHAFSESRYFTSPTESVPQR